MTKVPKTKSVESILNTLNLFKSLFKSLSVSEITFLLKVNINTMQLCQTAELQL